MKNEQTPYEVLELKPGASRKEIERAYYLARLAYDASSPASYSLYTTGERMAILRRIERAYRALTGQVESDSPEEGSLADTSRGVGAVDARNQRHGLLDRPVVSFDVPSNPDSLDPAAGASLEALRRKNEEEESPGLRIAISNDSEVEALQPRRLPPPPVPSSPVIDAIDIKGPYDGPTLRKIREARGLTLKEISDNTKISMTNLRLIESSDCATLPATVYLRGFLLEYARSLHLDPRPVMEGYLEIVRAARAAQESQGGGVDTDG